ncbi:hypothetical protein HHI36_019591, partial [Cryptolaemus montrouzieri]
EVSEGYDDTNYEVLSEEEYSDDNDSLANNNDNSADSDATNVQSSIHWDDVTEENQNEFTFYNNTSINIPHLVDDITPSNVFMTFVNHNLLVIIVEETNRNAAQYIGRIRMTR